MCTRPFGYIKHVNSYSSGPEVYSQLHKKAYNLVVCEFGGFENVLCDAGVHAILT